MSDQKTLTVQEKVAYGAGQIAENIKNYAFNYFVLFYYSQLLGVSASLTGLAIFIGMLADAITDPLVGSISDRWQSKWGRRHPLMYVSIVPLGLTFFCVFAPLPGLGEFGMFLWLTFFTIACRFAITLFMVPYTAMTAELTDHYTERTSISQFRYAIGVAGIFAVFGLAFLVFFAGEKGQFDVGSYPAYGAALALIMMVSMFWASRGTHHLIPRMHFTGGAGGGGLAQIFQESGSVLNNRSFRNFFLGVLILFVMVGVEGALFIYVGTYIWQFERDQFFYLTVSAAFGYLVGAFFTRALHERFDKKPIVILGISWWAFFQVFPIFLWFGGLLPAAGSTALLVVLVTMRFVQYIGTAQSMITSPSMIADVADEHELETGRRQEGIFYGALTFSAKATSGLGKFIAGVALDLIAWPKGQNVLPADVPAEKIWWLAMTFGPIVCGFAVVSVWCVMKYSITKNRHEQILAELKTRKELAGSVAKLVDQELAKDDVRAPVDAPAPNTAAGAAPKPKPAE